MGKAGKKAKKKAKKAGKKAKKKAKKAGKKAKKKAKKAAKKTKKAAKKAKKKTKKAVKKGAKKAKGGSGGSATGTSAVHAANKRAAYERGHKHGAAVKRSYKRGVQAGKNHLNKWKDRRMGINKAIAHAHREAPHTYKRKSGSSSARARRQAKRAARRQVRAAKRSAKKSAKKQAKRAAAATPKEEVLLEEDETEYSPDQGMVEHVAKDFDAHFDNTAEAFPVQDTVEDDFDPHFDDEE